MPLRMMSERTHGVRRADGSVLELAPLSAEWSAQEIPYSVTGSYNYTDETGWSWMDLTSDGSVQLGVRKFT